MEATVWPERGEVSPDPARERYVRGTERLCRFLKLDLFQ